jgi:primosomal protein N' (replication factor Y)
MTYHKNSNVLKCHYCGYEQDIPKVCPNCESSHIRFMGTGTEKVEEEIARVVPNARVTRLDGDTATSERALRSIVSSFERGESDILVGTQIVTKGFDFGGVTTVGILNADNLLSQPNFRASERAYQQIMQVAGRAGRRNKRGRVIIQTSQPQHPVIRYVASGDYHAMARSELMEREAFGYPPYSHLVRLTLHCNNYELLRHTAHYTTNLMRRKFGNRVMGPVAASREMLRGEYYAEIALKIESGASMKRARTLLNEVVETLKANREYKAVTISIDVDAW